VKEDARHGAPRVDARENHPRARRAYGVAAEQHVAHVSAALQPPRLRFEQIRLV
jgi:hypothetical protein